MKSATVFLLCLGLLSGCDTLRSLNPFGGGNTRAVYERGSDGELVIAEPPVRDGSIPAPAIRSHRIDRSRQGVILVVETVAQTQGYYGAKLYRRNFGEPDANGVLSYEFRVKPPEGPATPGPERTRILQAADFISEGELRSITRIVIRSAGQDLILTP